jgi:hypothetical protein
MTATWTNLHNAGLTYGDEFTYHGAAKNAYQLTGIRVRIERWEGQGNAFRLINVETGESVSHATSLKRAMWWVA